MKPTRIAILGVYRSGSTAVAGALHHLGVDMGAPFEFADLMSNPRRELDRLMDYLQITADDEKIATALRFIEPGARSKVEREQGEKLGAEKEAGRKTVWAAIRKAVTGRGK